MVLFSAVPSVRQREQPLPPEIIENTIATMIAVVMNMTIAGLTVSLVAISAHRARRKRATAEARQARHLTCALKKPSPNGKAFLFSTGNHLLR